MNYWGGEVSPHTECRAGWLEVEGSVQELEVHLHTHFLKQMVWQKLLCVHQILYPFPPSKEYA